MCATYDEQGNYIYPEGFDPDTGEWLEGFDEQRKLWEDQYAKAHARWEAHVKQQPEAAQAEGAAGEGRGRRGHFVLQRWRDRRGRGRQQRGGGRLARLRRGAAGPAREAHR